MNTRRKIVIDVLGWLAAFLVTFALQLVSYGKMQDLVKKRGLTKAEDEYERAANFISPGNEILASHFKSSVRHSNAIWPCLIPAIGWPVALPISLGAIAWVVVEKTRTLLSMWFHR